MGGQAPFKTMPHRLTPAAPPSMRKKPMALDPWRNQRFVQRTHGPKLSDGRMKPRPMRPRMAKATSIHSEEPRLTNTMRPKDSANSPNPILTKNGWAAGPPGGPRGRW